MNFNEWVESAAKKIPDPALNQQFTQLMGNITQAVPEFNQFGDQSLMLRSDYSRVIHEQRQERERLEQQLAQEREQLERDRAASQALMENTNEAQKVFDAYSKVHKVITDLQLTEVLFKEPVELPEPINLERREEPIMSQTNNGVQLSDQDISFLKDWIAKASAPVTAPQEQAQAVTPDMLQTVFAAANIASTEIMQKAARYTQLTGNQVDVSKLSLEFHQSGKSLDVYLDEKLNLPTLEAEAAQKAQQQLIEARAQELFNTRLTQHLTDPTNGGGHIAATGRPPLFDLLTTSPKLAQQNSSPAPAQSGSTPPPSVPNSAEALSGLDSAAASLASGKYSGQRYNPLTPLNSGQ